MDGIIKKPSEKEAAELRKWAEEVIELGYDEFERLKPDLPGWGGKIMRFYMLPYSELHDRFDEVLIKPVREVKMIQEEGRLRGLIKSGIRNFIADKHLDDFQAGKVKYHLVSRFTTKDSILGDDERIQIGIPYELDGIVKFAGSIVISKKNTPRVFDGCISKYPWFSGDTEFSFLSGK